nr:hypothetical protein [Methylobacterium oryzae]
MVSEPSPWTPWGPPPDAAFIAQAGAWIGQAETAFTDLVWRGYAQLRTMEARFDTRDLERSITEQITAAIDDEVPGEAPYYVQHSPFERETMLAPPAQPPAYDLAFVMRADPRIMWPVEAKILITPKALADYVADVVDQFLTCRYAPFSPSGAMLGYLLSGAPEDTLANIAKRLGVRYTETTPLDTERPHRSAWHARTVPADKAYPSPFRCHHLILGFHGLSRASAAASI